jgi:high-affinity Fe2+/Pb2+ permease
MIAEPDRNKRLIFAMLAGVTVAALATNAIVWLFSSIWRIAT